MPKCPSCSKVNPTASKFCANCGGKLPISPPTREVTPRITEPSSVGSAAYIAISVGGFFLLMGWAAIDTADTSEDLARGTIIEDDPFSNQLNENMRNKGYSQCAVGIVICLIGVVLAGIGESSSKSTLEDGGSQRHRSKELARKRKTAPRPPKPKAPPPPPRVCDCGFSFTNQHVMVEHQKICRWSKAGAGLESHWWDSES